ncbi:MAG: hypothetical protein VKM34_07870 [Cyanobacteriota bacterium]|nr:hypothetical protein [Cyanobacteriota bacterium]
MVKTSVPQPQPLLPGLLRTITAVTAISAVTAITAVTAPSPVLAQLRDPPYPSRDSLRQLQLLTFTCSRDNQPAACEQARQMADPLLDHPRLSGSCKDSLWQIRQQATVAPANSFSRRDQLDRLAVQMLRSCQTTPQPVAPTAPSRPGPPGQP